ncbi:unnamed protein product [Ciceribacter sp. T2.26MG-112.2]|nr:unnamed protein product [Ciceribacter naphthalenivorans]
MAVRLLLQGISIDILIRAVRFNDRKDIPLPCGRLWRNGLSTPLAYKAAARTQDCLPPSQRLWQGNHREAAFRVGFATVGARLDCPARDWPVPAVR